MAHPTTRGHCKLCFVEPLCWCFRVCCACSIAAQVCCLLVGDVAPQEFQQCLPKKGGVAELNSQGLKGRKAKTLSAPWTRNSAMKPAACHLAQQTNGRGDVAKISEQAGLCLQESWLLV